MKTKNINDQSFSQWTKDELFLYLQLIPQDTHPLLTKWLKVTDTLPEIAQIYLQMVQQ